MAEVVALETRHMAINAQCIDLLEEMLNRAKTGEVQEVAFAVVYDDASTGWRRSGTDNVSVMIGATSILLHNLHLYAEEKAHTKQA